MLTNLLESYSLVNVVKGPTCFKSVEHPSHIYVILTNTPKHLISNLNVAIGVIDYHNIVCAATRLYCPANMSRSIVYRSYKSFSEEKFKTDIEQISFHVCEIFDDINYVTRFHNQLFLNVINEHAPQKQRTIKHKQVPYMNGKLRKAINVKAMLRRKFNTFRTDSAWYKCRHQRNLVTCLKRVSTKMYFDERCKYVHGANSRVFWKTISPFLSNNGRNQISTQHLLEGEKVVTSQTDLMNIS